MPVVSFPSLKVPAPPSPNWTLDSVSSSPVFQNLSTAAVRVSTSCPRSRTSGLYPALARISAANIPAGPNPTITGLCLSVPESDIVTASIYLISGAISSPSLLFGLSSKGFPGAFAETTVKSTEYTSRIADLSRASMDSFTTFHSSIKRPFAACPSFFKIFSGSLSRGSPGLSFIW